MLLDHIGVLGLPASQGITGESKVGPSIDSDLRSFVDESLRKALEGRSAETSQEIQVRKFIW